MKNKDKNKRTAIESFKAIITIITGLTITNSIVMLLTNSSYKDVYSFKDLSWISILTCLFVVINVIRFFHGNIKHINEEYVYDFQQYRAKATSVGGRFIADFIVIFTQSIIFSIMSFYINHYSNFIIAVLVLLLVDIMWVISKFKFENAKEILRYKVWLINNLSIGVIITVIFFTKIAYSNFAITITYTLLYINTAIDYYFNRHYYFPPIKKDKMDSIFFCAPYIKKIDNETKLINEEFKDWLSKIIEYFKKNIQNVNNSHVREEWGANIYPPSDAIRHDFSDIRNADCVIAYIGNPPSSGVLVELGFAAAIKKPIVIFTENKQLIPYFVLGLNNWTNTKIIVFDSLEDLFDKFNQEFKFNGAA